MVKPKQVQQYLDGLIRADPNLSSVWVYSWPDARTLIPVAHAGFHVNPLPLGYFWVTDYKEVGGLVMERCVEMDRLKHLVACPIMAENDAWGVAVFELKENKARSLALSLCSIDSQTFTHHLPRS